MMTLKIGEKELKVKFGYKPTLKSRIITRMVRQEKEAEGLQENDEVGALEKVEDLMLIVPEIILVGLQKFHKEEYGYNYDTNEGKDVALDKIYDLMDEYFENQGSDFIKLYNDLQEEMLKESFLASVFREEEAKAEKSRKKQEKTED